MNIKDEIKNINYLGIIDNVKSYMDKAQTSEWYAFVKYVELEDNQVMFGFEQNNNNGNWTFAIPIYFITNIDELILNHCYIFHFKFVNSCSCRLVYDATLKNLL